MSYATENFHLRNEIYELQDKINRQVLQINKLEKSADSNQQMSNAHHMGTGMDMNPYEDDDDMDDNDIYGDVVEDDADFIEDAMTDNNNTNHHDRATSIT